MICDEADELFTCAQCHTLASAIHDRTGLGISILYAAGEPQHAIVNLAPGLYGDVRGVYSREVALDWWFSDQVRPWTYDGKQTDVQAATQAFYDRHCTIECAWEAAYAFAPAVEQLWREQLPELSSFRNPLLFGQAAA